MEQACFLPDSSYLCNYQPLLMYCMSRSFAAMLPPSPGKESPESCKGKETAHSYRRS